MTRTIKAVYYAQDGGDGSQGFKVYPDLETLKNHAFDPRWNTPEEVEDKYEKALSAECPYEYGEIGNIDIEVEEVNGELRLAKSFSASLG